MKQRFRCRIPMDLQIFAEGGEETGDGGTGGAGASGGTGSPAGSSTPATIDYDKIQKMLDGTLAAKEDTALKAYFKQQGLSQQEVEQAIETFKTQKAANQPNVEALQQQTTAAQQAALSATIERDAYMMSGELGVDNKTMSYMLRMADLSAVTDNGKVLQDKLKEALNKVLEEIPQLKPQADAQQSGFRQIGVGNQQQSAPAKTTNQNTVPAKRWNRFN